MTNVGPTRRWMHGIREPTHEYQICDINWLLIFGGYVEVRGYLYTQVYYLGQYYSKPRMILGWFYLGMKVLTWYMDPNGITTKVQSNTRTLLSIKKCEILILIALVLIWLEEHGIFPLLSSINWKPTPIKWVRGKCLIGNPRILGRQSPPLLARFPRFGYYSKVSLFGLSRLKTRKR